MPHSPFFLRCLRASRISSPRCGSALGLATCLLTVLVSLPSGAGDWPQWRGPRRDGHAAPGEVLPVRLPAQLEPRWRVPVGGGFSSPIVVGSRLFLADEHERRETVRAFDIDSGRELWRTPFAESFGDEWGSGPRCTPLADEGRLYLQSIKGEFACLDQVDGRRLWGFSFERDYGVAFVGGNDAVDAASRRRGHTGAPAILGSRVYVQVGATNGASIAAFDKVTGREVWRSGRDETAYAPLVIARFADQDHVVAYTAGGLTGHDPDTGAPLWKFPLRSHANRHAATPIAIARGESVDFLISSHTLGYRSLRVTRGGEGWATRTHWHQPQLKISIATLVEVEGHLYGQGPDKDLLCLDAATGDLKWSQPGFGGKPITGFSATLAVGKRLLVHTEDGLLVLVAADPARYHELGRAHVSGKTWSHPALAGGRLFLRDARQLLAFDLGTTSSR